MERLPNFEEFLKISGIEPRQKHPEATINEQQPPEKKEKLKIKTCLNIQSQIEKYVKFRLNTDLPPTSTLGDLHWQMKNSSFATRVILSNFLRQVRSLKCKPTVNNEVVDYLKQCKHRKENGVGLSLIKDVGEKVGAEEI